MGLFGWLARLFGVGKGRQTPAAKRRTAVHAAAKAIGARASTLAYHLFHNPAPYRTFTIPKRDGTARQIAEPCPGLKKLQRRIASRILSKPPLAPQAHGFRKRRSILSNARIHTRQPLVIHLDLKDFFPTITFSRVYGLFRGLGHDRPVAGLLARLCVHDGRLPQGAPSSPAITNLICRRLDHRLYGLAVKAGGRYTRYADDLTFSGPLSLRSILPAVRKIIREEGFEVAEKKTRLMRAVRRQEVTGLVVNQRPGVPRRQRRLLRAILHNAARQGLAAQNRSNIPHFGLWLAGWIQYVNMVNKAQGSRLIALLQKVSARS